MNFQRDESLVLLQDAKPFDILIIGGGATGLGAAVDAALRGHRVALIEQSDFAKGTSSRSTKLVHGGVRYLRQGNISLVLEALKERGLLLANAPHLAHDMEFVIPTYRWWEKPFYGIGMKLYDALAGKLGLGRSRLLNHAQTAALIPTIAPQKLAGGVLYHDGQFDDARLALNLAQTAAECGAVVANYVRAVGLVKESDRISGVEAEDVETGERFVIRANCVVNATGVFVDELRRKDEGEVAPMVAVSQGIHLVLPREFLPGRAALMIPQTDDGRVLFAVPWHDHVVVGTTDTPLDAPSLEPRALPDEIEFVMSHIGHYLTRTPQPSDVRSVFAGLRPLVKQGEGANTSRLARDHTIVVSSSGLLTVTGGKWTTYRKMAEDVVAQAETIAGLSPRECKTQQHPLHGATRDTIAEGNLRAYGSDAAAVRSTLAEAHGWKELLHPELSLQAGEVVWQTRHEMARTVEDVLARRTRMLLLHAHAAIDVAPRVASLMASELGRDADWERKQVQEFSDLARGYLLPE